MRSFVISVNVSHRRDSCREFLAFRAQTTQRRVLISMCVCVTRKWPRRFLVDLLQEKIRPQQIKALTHGALCAAA